MKRLFWCPMLAAAVLTGSAAAAQADSLYREDKYQPLAADRKAHRPGDSITVLVLEQASASASADTSTDRNTSLGMHVAKPNYQAEVAAGIGDDFSGKGKIQRSGRLLAQITVTVVSVAQNGDLDVKGEQVLVVNEEKQAIKLEGRIRRADLSETNTVSSNRLANARISYVGYGVLSEAQRPGIFTAILRAFGL